jgi:hypothetical protein
MAASKIFAIIEKSKNIIALRDIQIEAAENHSDTQGR